MSDFVTCPHCGELSNLGGLIGVNTNDCPRCGKPVLGNNMTTREEKVLALTKNELVFVSESPEWLDDTAKFFANGGFNAYTDEQLNEQYQDAIDEGVEP